MPRMPYTPPAAATAQEFTVGFRTALGATTSAQTGHHGVMLTNSNTIIAYAGCRLPFTPSAIYAVYQVWATGNIYRQVEGAWGAAGEAINATTDSIAYGATAVTTTVITEEDITAAFTGVASGDTISCRYTRDATNASDTAEGDGFIMHLRIVP